jgi:hypothetical protein
MVRESAGGENGCQPSLINPGKRLDIYIEQDGFHRPWSLVVNQLTWGPARLARNSEGKNTSSAKICLAVPLFSIDRIQAATEITIA